jgi:hypothetical protein
MMTGKDCIKSKKEVKKMEKEHETVLQEIGQCPHCHEPYGYIIDIDTNEPVNEYSHCTCLEEVVEEKREVAL